MKFEKISLICMIILLSAIPLTAQEWQWEADYSFLTPHVDPEAVIQLRYGPTAFYDLDNDGVDDPIAGFTVLDQDGDFPNITWRIREHNCFDGLEIDGEDFIYESPIYHDLDGDDFPEVIVYSTPEYVMNELLELRVYHNRGDYDNPDWVRDDDLFFDIIGDAGDEEYCIPMFCDWDGNGRTDLLVIYDYDMGYHRFEEDEEGNWEELGDPGWIPYADAANRLADFNGDGVMDIVITSTHRFMAQRQTNVRLNIGSVEDPDFSDPYFLNFYWVGSPFPYDIDNDGIMDLIDGDNFILNTGEDELEGMWDRPNYWGMSLTANSILYDFNDDRVLDIVRGTDLSWLQGGEVRFDQYQLTDAGWQDSQFFGYDFREVTYNEWPEYRALKAVEMLEEGSPCLLKVAYADVGYPAPMPVLTLLENVSDDGEWEWQSVDGFFDAIIDTTLTHQIPSFGDLDNDGDQDMGRLEGTHSDSLHVVFYQI